MMNLSLRIKKWIARKLKLQIARIKFFDGDVKYLIVEIDDDLEWVYVPFSKRYRLYYDSKDVVDKKTNNYVGHWSQLRNLQPNTLEINLRAKNHGDFC